MAMTFTLTKAYLDSKDLKCQVVDDEKALRVGFNVDTGSIEIIVIFDDNDRTVALRCFSYIKIPAAKKDEMYKVCSEMNDCFRWIRFYVNEKNVTITMALDAVVQLDTCGEEIEELLMRMASIGNEAYPKFMRAIYAG